MHSLASKIDKDPYELKCHIRAQCAPRHKKRSRHSDAVWGNFLMDWEFCLSKLPRFSPIIESLAVVISHICGNRSSLWMFTSLHLYLWSKFPQNKQNCGDLPEVQVQLIDILYSLSGWESRYFEEILNPQKSVCGRISIFLMSAFWFSASSQGNFFSNNMCFSSKNWDLLVKRLGFL